MKITIEFNENNLTSEQAARMTLDCLQTSNITKLIKSNKNVKFKWEDGTCAVMTQQGVLQVIVRRK